FVLVEGRPTVVRPVHLLHVQDKLKELTDGGRCKLPVAVLAQQSDSLQRVEPSSENSDLQLDGSGIRPPVAKGERGVRGGVNDFTQDAKRLAHALSWRLEHGHLVCWSFG